jgi:hypothetical protein
MRTKVRRMSSKLGAKLTARPAVEELEARAIIRTGDEPSAQDRAKVRQAPQLQHAATRCSTVQRWAIF